MELIAIDKESWFTELIDDCKYIMGDLHNTAKQYEETKLELYKTIKDINRSKDKDLTAIRFQLGLRMLQDNENFERAKIYGEGISKKVAAGLHLSIRIVDKSRRFAKVMGNLAIYRQYVAPAFELKYGKEPTWTINERYIVPALELYLKQKDVNSLSDIPPVNANTARTLELKRLVSNLPVKIQGKLKKVMDMPNLEKDFKECRVILRTIMLIDGLDKVLPHLLTERAEKLLKNYDY